MRVIGMFRRLPAQRRKHPVSKNVVQIRDLGFPSRACSVELIA